MENSEKLVRLGMPSPLAVEVTEQISTGGGGEALEIAQQANQTANQADAKADEALAEVAGITLIPPGASILWPEAQPIPEGWSARAGTVTIGGVDYITIYQLAPPSPGTYQLLIPAQTGYAAPLVNFPIPISLLDVEFVDGTAWENIRAWDGENNPLPIYVAAYDPLVHDGMAYVAATISNTEATHIRVNGVPGSPAVPVTDPLGRDAVFSAYDVVFMAGASFESPVGDGRYWYCGTTDDSNAHAWPMAYSGTSEAIQGHQGVSIDPVTAEVIVTYTDILRKYEQYVQGPMVLTGSNNAILDQIGAYLAYPAGKIATHIGGNAMDEDGFLWFMSNSTTSGVPSQLALCKVNARDPAMPLVEAWQIPNDDIWEYGVPGFEQWHGGVTLVGDEVWASQYKPSKIVRFSKGGAFLGSIPLTDQADNAVRFDEIDDICHAYGGLYYLSSGDDKVYRVEYDGKNWTSTLGGYGASLIRRSNSGGKMGAITPYGAGFLILRTTSDNGWLELFNPMGVAGTRTFGSSFTDSGSQQFVTSGVMDLTQFTVLASYLNPTSVGTETIFCVRDTSAPTSRAVQVSGGKINVWDNANTWMSGGSISGGWDAATNVTHHIALKYLPGERSFWLDGVEQTPDSIATWATVPNCKVVIASNRDTSSLDKLIGRVGYVCVKAGDISDDWINFDFKCRTNTAFTVE